MEVFLNLVQVRNIIGDYANINLDTNFNATYKCCDICNQQADEYFHIKSDPLYIMNGRVNPIIMKRNPYSNNYILVKSDIREKYFPHDMIWVRYKDVIILKDRKFPDMERMKFYEYICNKSFFRNDFSPDFKIITHCEKCKKEAFTEVDGVNLDKLEKVIKNDLQLLK